MWIISVKAIKVKEINELGRERVIIGNWKWFQRVKSYPMSIRRGYWIREKSKNVSWSGFEWEGGDQNTIWEDE